MQLTSIKVSLVEVMQLQLKYKIYKKLKQRQKLYADLF